MNKETQENKTEPLSYKSDNELVNLFLYCYENFGLNKANEFLFVEELYRLQNKIKNKTTNYIIAKIMRERVLQRDIGRSNVRLVMLRFIHDNLEQLEAVESDEQEMDREIKKAMEVKIR